MKLALITGASSGLGEALARLLAKKKIPLILTGRNKERLEEIGRSLEAEILILDLAKDRAPLINLIREKKPDLVINNAGFALYGPAISHPILSEIKILEVNANAALEVTLEAANALRLENRPGTILNISSVAAEFPFPSMAVYAAAKAFLTSFSKSFDFEMRPFKIRILTSMPGQITTPFAEKASEGYFHQKKSLLAMSPEYVAEKIWRQIEKKKSLSIIDWRYRLALFLSKMIPPKILASILSNSISRRLKKFKY